MATARRVALGVAVASGVLALNWAVQRWLATSVLDAGPGSEQPAPLAAAVRAVISSTRAVWVALTRSAARRAAARARAAPRDREREPADAELLAYADGDPREADAAVSPATATLLVTWWVRLRAAGTWAYVDVPAALAAARLLTPGDVQRLLAGLQLVPLPGPAVAVAAAAAEPSGPFRRPEPYISRDSAAVKTATRVLLAAQLQAGLAGRAVNAGASARALADFVAALTQRAGADARKAASLAWCIAGDRCAPDDGIAAVFAVQWAAGPGALPGAAGGGAAHAAATGTATHAATTTYAYIPLVSNALWRNACSAVPSAAGREASGSDDQHLALAPRAERWRGLAAVLAAPGLPKFVFDAKSHSYALLLCPVTAGCAVEGLWDPLLAAWLLSPDTVSKGTSLHPLPLPQMVAAGLLPPPQTAAGAADTAEGRGSEGAPVAGDRPAGAAGAEGAASSTVGVAGVAAVIGGRPAWSYRAPARATVAPYDRHRLLSLAQLAAAYHVDLRAPAPAANMQLDAAGAPGRDLDVLAHLDGLAAVCGALRSVIAARGLTAAFERQEMPLAVSLAAMEVAGVGFDVAGLDAASAAAAAHMALLEDEAHQVAGRVFDLGSPDEVAQVLFEHLGLKRPDPEDLPHVQRAAARAGAGGADADAGVDVQYREEQTLQAMLPQGHPVVGILLEHKKLVRAQAGIVARLRDAALSTAQRDGVVAALPGGAGGAEARLPGGLGAADASLHRIHSLLSQIGTGTGRISSAYPNLQNIPNPERFGLDAAGAPVLNIRRLFRPAGRRTVLMAVDFAQIEMRVMAHASGDASMLRVFGSAEAAAAATAAAATAAATTPVPTAAVPAWASGDIYRQMAAQIFGLASPAAVTSAQRNTAKTLTLGLIYGMGHAAAARKLGIPQQEAYELKEAFLLRFPGVGLFFSNARMFAARYGHVLTLAGRQRLLPDIICDDDGRRMYAQRQAVNSIIQGTAADLIKLAMNLVDARLRTGAGGVGPGRSDGGTAPPRGRLLLQIHDELLLECPDEPDAIRALAREVTRIMTVEVPAALEAIALAGPFAPPTGAAAADEYHRAARLILGGSARLRVPLAVSVEVGPDWGSMRPYRVE